MTISLEIRPDVEPRLLDEATRRGVDPSAMVAILVDQGLSAASPRPTLSTAEPGRGDSLRELFAEWAAEDATDDPAEVQRRQQEFEEFKAGMTANSLSRHAVYP